MIYTPEHPNARKWIKYTYFEDDFNRFYDQVIKEDKFQRMDVEAEKKRDAYRKLLHKSCY